MSTEGLDPVSVNHPTWQCPGDGPFCHTPHPCCPCEHNLLGCCWHCPDVDPPGTHDHDCLPRPDEP